MFALPVVLTVLLLLETLPSAAAGLARQLSHGDRGRALGACLLSPRSRSRP